MEGRGDHGEPVAIIGVACRFPGARDPAEFHELTVTRRRMFQPAAALPGRPLRAALLDDWIVPPDTHGNYLGQAQPDPGQLDVARSDMARSDMAQLDLGQLDPGPLLKLATEMAALALTDAGLREAAGNSRTGLIIASSVPGLSNLVSGQLGLASSGPYPRAANTSSLHAVAAAAAALQDRQIDLAITGGAELGLDPVWLALQARAGTLGTDEMRVYAADPAGLLPGDGCGVVILVRAADARAAGVPVYAEIAGWSAVPAGPPELLGRPWSRRTGGPEPIRRTCSTSRARAPGPPPGIGRSSPRSTQLRRGMEASGRTAALGAAAAGIGYARAAAGIASLIKTAVAMAAGTIPPGPGGARPHPLIASGEARLRLPAGRSPGRMTARARRGPRGLPDLRALRGPGGRGSPR